MIRSYFDALKNKTVGFIGIGISNMPIIRIFVNEGISVTLRDVKEKLPDDFAEEIQSLGITTFNGENYLKNIYEDVLFLSPGVKQFLPELLQAKSNGTILTTEMQEFLKLCPCKTIGVTGSDGKTTTTTLISKFLEADGKKVHLGGNIGKNLFACLNDIGADDFAVIELSSFQLMKMSVSPDIAVITNVSPNHLDWHNSYEEYIEAKTVIYKYQNENGRCVFNASNDITAKLASAYLGQGSTFGKSIGDFHVEPEGIYHGDVLILSDADILLPGMHNRENYAAAIAATYGLVSKDSIVKTAQEFGGVEHRIELVREFNGVKYYNSSIDSSPSRTAAALESFKDKVIVIAGGYDKKIPLEPLGDLFKRKTKSAILIGNTGVKIADILKACGYSGPIYMAVDMEDAVNHAASIAVSGDTVILSPAAASFDLYKNFMERGNIFKKIVKEL